MKYEDLKIWYKNHRQQIIFGFCFALIFLVGFGSGRAEKEYRKEVRPKQLQLNNTIQTTPPPAVPAASPVPVTTGMTTSANCIVKGNISGQNKIYHVKGGSFYERTQAEQCFATEQEAVAAGFRKSSR